MTDSSSLSIDLPDEASTMSLGASLAGLHELRGLVFLHGELGAGKTTLVRGFMRAMGHQGPVKSPTYTLIEPYHFKDRAVFHLDIYRLQDPGELDDLGVRELLTKDSTLLIEWPERAEGRLGEPVLEIALSYSGDARKAVLRTSHPDLMDNMAQSFRAFSSLELS